MRSRVSVFVATSLLVVCVIASAQSSSPAGTMKVVTIHLSGKDAVPISPLLYGINYDWNAVSEGETAAFASSMQSVAHVTMVRYPGGWNAEHYDWSNNTETRWRHFSPATGASPATILRVFPQVSFITPSGIAISDPRRASEVAKLSSELVSRYGNQVKVWEIGNEWFLQRGAKNDRQKLLENLRLYAALLNQVVPPMKKANPSIQIYAMAEWNSVEDARILRKLTTRKVWSQIDGISIHPYCGTSPDESACTLLQPRIASLRAATHKDAVYASEWAVVRNHSKDDFGIHNANATLAAIQDMAFARVRIATYWPPVREIPALGFVSRDFSTPLATGILYGWMSKYYEGVALHTSGDCLAAAARNHGQVTVFVPSATQGPEQVQIDIAGMGLHQVVTAKVLVSASPDDLHQSGHAIVAMLPVRMIRSGNGDEMVNFTLDPGTNGRGQSYEIARVILQ